MDELDWKQCRFCGQEFASAVCETEAERDKCADYIPPTEFQRGFRAGWDEAVRASGAVTNGSRG